MSKRPDRTEKLLKRKTHQETVVKCTLKSLLIGGSKEEIVQAIQERVHRCSVRTFNASVALNLLVRENAEGLPDFWEQTFVRQLMLGTEGAVKPHHVITDLFKRHPNLLSKDGRNLDDRNIYSAAAKKLSTNIKNHLVLNFPKVVKRYLYDASSLEKDNAVDALYAIHGWEQKARIGQGNIDRTVQDVRAVLRLAETDKVDKQWFKRDENLHNMLRLFIFVSKSLQGKTYPDGTPLALFNILPICRIKHHFITIDKFVLPGVLKDAGIMKKTSDASGLEGELWDSVLDVSRVAGRGKEFTGTVETDGFAVCVHFQRPKNTCDKPPTSLEGKRVIGVDPGRTNIFCMAEKRSDGSFKRYNLSRSQYYSASGIFRARERTDRWNLEVKEELEAISKASPKSATLESFQMYIDALEATKDALWDEYLKRRWQEQRFRLYGGKKRVFSKFLNILGPPVDVVLAFGAAKFAPGGKGELSVPTSRAFKECSYRFPIVPVDEFRTSKVYWKDDSVLQTVKVARADGKLKASRGLLWCGSTNRNEFVNRDLNAAINMLRCAVPRRPDILNRSKATSRLSQTVGKILHC